MNKPPTQKASLIKKWIRSNFLLRPIKNLKGDRILDLGCGWGISFTVNPNFYGIDADEQCINFLSEKGYNVKKCDLTNELLPFPDNYFDNIFTHDVLEHFTLKENHILFKEAYRALKTNGYFLNILPNYKGYMNKINTGHKHFVTKNDILDFSNGKFELIKCYNYPIFFSFGENFTHNKSVYLLKKI